MKRMLGIDAAQCDACGARMKLCALLTLPASIERFTPNRFSYAPLAALVVVPLGLLLGVPLPAAFRRIGARAPGE